MYVFLVYYLQAFRVCCVLMLSINVKIQLADDVPGADLYTTQQHLGSHISVRLEEVGEDVPVSYTVGRILWGRSETTGEDWGHGRGRVSYKHACC